MKKSLKIIIPVALVLIVLITACWFFLFYNRTIATNLLQNSAQLMVSHGRYGRAVSQYRSAWKLMPERTDLPIELAETYAASGNYTKAEYTLVSAIAANPNNYELYAALCRTYVEQDKLLDAVQMLDRISSETVKETLAEQRPEAPVISPESGYYNEYIQVAAESAEATVYLTTDGEYPSNDSHLYSAPIDLETGETTVIALAVDEDGLVSPAAVCGFTIGGVVEEITIGDTAIDTVVREHLHLEATDTLMTDDLWSIAALELPETVADISALSNFAGLKTLTIHNVSGLDFTVLRQLPGLTELDLSGCTISTEGLEAIGSLTELQKLVLDGCAITDLTPFTALTKLTHLTLSNNSVEDISVLSLMLDLEEVKLANNPISSIAALSTCNQLKMLDITRCGISSLGSLSDKEELTSLLASNNKIADLSPLENCKNLSQMVLTENLIDDISILTSLSGLTEFTADHNKIKEIPDFDEESCILVRFSANYNEIESVSGLKGIASLNYVNLDYNKVKDISPLTGNYNLIQLDVWDNPIPEVTEAVKPFEESSIIVNFNPKYEAPKE